MSATSSTGGSGAGTGGAPDRPPRRPQPPQIEAQGWDAESFVVEKGTAVSVVAHRDEHQRDRFVLRVLDDAGGDLLRLAGEIGRDFARVQQSLSGRLAVASLQRWLVDVEKIAAELSSPEMYRLVMSDGGGPSPAPGDPNPKQPTITPDTLVANQTFDLIAWIQNTSGQQLTGVRYYFSVQPANATVRLVTPDNTRSPWLGWTLQTYDSGLPLQSAGTQVSTLVLTPPAGSAFSTIPANVRITLEGSTAPLTGIVLSVNPAQPWFQVGFGIGSNEYPAARPYPNYFPTWVSLVPSNTGNLR